MTDIDLKQFYDSIADKFASTLMNSSYECVGFAQYHFWCPHTATKHPNGRMPKLSVNFQKDVFHCWVCHFKGTPSEYMKGKGIVLDEKEQEIYDGNKNEKPKDSSEKYVRDLVTIPEYTPITSKNYQSSRVMSSAYKYVTNRLHCSMEFIEEFEIGVCSTVHFKEKIHNIQTITVPSYDKNLRPNYYFQRQFPFGNGKYNPPIEKSKAVAFESRIDWNKEDVVLVEGGFDSLRLWNLGIQNIPLLGQYISKQFLLFDYLKNYGITPVIFMDQDAEEEAQKFADYLTDPYRMKSVVYNPYKEIEKEYPEDLRGNLDPAVLKTEHLLRLKDLYDV